MVRVCVRNVTLLWLILALFELGGVTNAAQHGPTSTISTTSTCSPSNIISAAIQGTLPSGGGTVNGDTTGRGDAISQPCGGSNSVNDAIYGFMPSTTGRYRFVVSGPGGADLLVYVVHCNGGTLYSSGYYSSSIYQNACQDDPPQVETVLFAGSQYYVVVSPFSSIHDSFFTLQATLLETIVVDAGVTVFGLSSTPRPTTGSSQPSFFLGNFPLLALIPIVFFGLAFISSIFQSVSKSRQARNNGVIVYDNQAARGGGGGGGLALTAFSTAPTPGAADVDAVVPLAILAEQPSSAASFVPSSVGAPSSAPPPIPQNDTIPMAALYSGKGT